MRLRCLLAGHGWQPGDPLVFMLLANDDGETDGGRAAARAAELERHLQRIGEEVHAARVVHSVEAPVVGGRLDTLTHRQWDIVTRLLRGERVPGIAASLHLSQNTIRNHLTAIFQKYGVHSQSELIEHLRSN